MDERARYRQFEDSFIAQVRARAMALCRGALPADDVQFETTSEGLDEARAALARLGLFDRGALEQTPGTQSLELRFRRLALGGLAPRIVRRVRVRVLAPPEVVRDGRAGGPIDREQVLDAVAVYELLPARQRPEVVVLASATGFTPQARALVEAVASVRLVLIGARPDGGWDVHMPEGLRDTRWARLLELETTDERLGRLLRRLDELGWELDSRGVSIEALAGHLGLPAVQVELLVRQACRRRPELMTMVHQGSVHVCRCPLPREGTMSIWSRMRRWLGWPPRTAERVREMTAQRVRLEQQRSELDRRVSLLEEQERQALAEGAQARSDAERRQVAGRLVRLRRELRRVRAQANLFTQQIDILGTHIHHLTLAEQGRRLELPSAEELTREASQAERILAQVSANADLAASIELTGASPLMAEEEAAILREFDQLAAGRPAAQPAATSVAAPQTAPGRIVEGPPAAEPGPAPPEHG